MSEQQRIWAETILPWQEGTGPDQDIVLLSEAALGRCLWAFPFPLQATEVERRTVLGEILRRLGDLAGFPVTGRFSLEEDSLLLRRCLHEKGFIDADTAHHTLGKGLLVSQVPDRAVVINEEDHLRIKAWRAGFDPRGAMQAALHLESDLDLKLEFAFSDEFGYLTACPTRVGTGLRLTSLLHLPGLVMAGEIDRIVNALRQLQFIVQGLGGQGKAVKGCLFLVSNLVTLGRSEDEVADDFAVHVGKIVLHERSARRQLYAADAIGLEDLAMRSLALGREARLMSLQEGFDHLSNLRLGVGLGILSGVRIVDLNRLLVAQQAAHIELLSGNSLRGKELMRARADMFRASLRLDTP